ncbi:class I SAM-dependent methyltransferase [Nostoc flagelliforme FACHB-838]|uniref:Class I SAM-dependent methyltransferase n=1 Tax=Nostoc flagelliforme FACHB-838 TaxID=2692904 RepID=A0ABR8DP96_9NOSO|nr:class I SAM-dependent methyltransferase [Nostoc flagelliforme]MBD2531277.1 class I SAM-dependent methyltransferase [Nostoc flagelliforme FACHB-838]
MDENEKRIFDSWQMNALLWTQAIREQQIESRAIATDAAIVKAVSQLNPRTFLDIGCGEGWLSRQLFSLGIDGWGVDFCADLIDAAKHSGDSRFVVCSYSDLVSQKFSTINYFSCFICNFSILGEFALDEIAKAGHNLLEEKGKIIIQTLHPIIACGDTYSNGWREVSWQPVADAAFHPTPWYFRTLESWINDFHALNYRLLNLYEPCNPKTNKPISIIFVFERQ